MLGLLNGHAIDMVNFLAHRIVTPAVRFTGQAEIVSREIQPLRDHQIRCWHHLLQIGHNRLGRGGVQEYFGVRADMVTYGKTLGGGLPVGVVCGRASLMKRFREDRPADICFARGTFNAHPYVMGAMKAFLDRMETPAVQELYEGLDERWNAWAARFNSRLEQEGLPVRVAQMSSVWTMTYTQPSRYNWMLQFYLRAHGLALSWVGSGRLIFSLNYRDEDLQAVLDRLVAAARQMQADGWWWRDAAMTDRAIRRSILAEMWAHWRGAPALQ